MAIDPIESVNDRFLREGEEMNGRDAYDDIELLRRVERSMPHGYRVPDGDVRTLLAAYRLCSNEPMRRGIFRRPLRSKSEGEPWVLVFADATRVSVARILDQIRECG